MTRKQYISLSSLGMGIFWVIMFIGSLPGISLSIYFLIALIVIQFGKNWDKEGWVIRPIEIFYLPLALVSFIPMWTQNDTAVSLAMFTTYITFVYVNCMIGYGKGLREVNVLSWAALSIGHLINLFPRLKLFQKENSRDLKIFSHITSRKSDVLMGLLIAIPLVSLFLLIFSVADPIFLKVFGDISSSLNPFRGEVFSRITFAILIALLWLSMMINRFYRLEDQKNNPVSNTRISPATNLTIITTLNAFFILFIVVQLKYFFGSEELFYETGITHAEYARKGFYELMFAAALSLSLVYILRYGVKKYSDMARVLVNSSIFVTLALTFLILVSSISRLNLYTQHFGLTNQRFWAQVIIIFLGATLISTSIMIWDQKLFRYAQAVILGIGLFMIIGAVAIVPDRHIARTNIQLVLDGERSLDASYLLARGNSDAYLELLNYLEEDRLVFSECHLLTRWEAESDRRELWQSFNIYRTWNSSRFEEQLSHIKTLCNQSTKWYY
jgi:hypothetical protein